jgi:hypothetical protein
MLQQAPRIAIVGPAGAFSDIAAGFHLSAMEGRPPRRGWAVNISSDFGRVTGLGSAKFIRKIGKLFLPTALNSYGERTWQ